MAVSKTAGRGSIPWSPALSCSIVDRSPQLPRGASVQGREVLLDPRGRYTPQSWATSRPAACSPGTGSRRSRAGAGWAWSTGPASCSLDRIVALKVIAPALTQDPAIRRRFMRESRDRRVDRPPERDPDLLHGRGGRGRLHRDALRRRRRPAHAGPTRGPAVARPRGADHRQVAARSTPPTPPASSTATSSPPTSCSARTTTST